MHKVDLHTHLVKNGASIQMLNIFAQDLPQPVDEIFYSAGLHPWHLELINPEKCMNALENAAGNQNMLAIGECGLDRSIKTDLVTQEGYFRKQIEIAEKFSKPLIIHCVRAFPEIIKLKKESHSNLPWIIHGYQGNLATTLQLIQHNFYFSVGESLLANAKKKEILLHIPLDHLFLETDDRKISIDSIYSKAAQLLEMDEETLSVQLFENFQGVFGKSGVGQLM